MDTNETLAQAITSLRKDDLVAAEAGLRRVIADEPDNADAHHFLGLLTYRRGDAEAAIENIRHALELNPQMAGAHNNLGNIFFALEREDEAAESYVAALKINPNLVDGWCNLGVIFRNQNQLPRAAEAAGIAVQVDPTHAESWHNLAMYLSAMGEVEGAAKAIERCAEVAGDTEWYSPTLHALTVSHLGRTDLAVDILTRYLERHPDHVKSRHMLAAMRGETMARASEAYVRAVFDSFSKTFDQNLKTLDYCAPELVAAELERLRGDGPEFPVAVDLGCGTGLGGTLIRPSCTRLVGVDLSSGMLRRAARRDVYDLLVEGELCAFLNAHPEGTFDVAVCIDTLVYIGELEPVFAAVRHALEPGAPFIATTERHEGDTPPYQLTRSGRFSHAESYIRAAAEDAGLAVTNMERVVPRKEFGEPVDGLLFTLTRP